MTLWTLVKKEGRVILRSRLLLVVLVLYPLVIVGIIGYAFSQPNQRVPIAVVNEDKDAAGNPNVAYVESPITGDTSRVEVSTLKILLGLSNFTDIQVTSGEDARNLLLTGEVQAVVHFPPNFARDIAKLETSAEVGITLDQSDPVRAKFMEVLIRGVIQGFQEAIVTEKVKLVIAAIDTSLLPECNPPAVVLDCIDEEQSLYPGFKGLRARILRAMENPNLSPEQRIGLNQSIDFVDRITNTLQNSKGIINSVAKPVSVALEQEKSGSLFIRDLIVPAALGLSIFWTGSLATSSLVVYEREAPAYTRLRISPASAWSIYGSKIVLTVTIILAQSLLILGAAVWAWDTRVDNLVLTILVILLSTFASMGLGLFLAGLSRDVNGTVLLSVLFTFPMLFLAGLFYPVSFMPKGAQLLANFFPLTYTVAGLRGAMLRGFDFGDAAVHLVALVLFGAGLTIVGIGLGKWMERKR